MHSDIIILSFTKGKRHKVMLNINLDLYLLYHTTFGAPPNSISASWSNIRTSYKYRIQLRSLYEKVALPSLSSVIRMHHILVSLASGSRGDPFACGFCGRHSIW